MTPRRRDPPPRHRRSVDAADRPGGLGKDRRTRLKRAVDADRVTASMEASEMASLGIVTCALRILFFAFGRAILGRMPPKNVIGSAHFGFVYPDGRCDWFGRLMKAIDWNGNSRVVGICDVEHLNI